MSDHVIADAAHPLKVAAASSPQSVATAIYKSITDSKHFPTLRAVGHGAVGQTAKAIAIASGQLAPKGTFIVTIIGFETIQNDDGKDISAMTFRLLER